MIEEDDNVVPLAAAREARREPYPVTRGWLLLRLRVEAAQPLWFIRTWDHAGPPGEDATATLERIRENMAEYTWAEGCGQPALPVTAIVRGDELDPPDLFEVVAFAPQPKDWQGEEPDWAALFPEMGQAALKGPMDALGAKADRGELPPFGSEWTWA